ncbi:sialate O-acetylesterase [Chitinophaga sp. CF118]|nr:sialate O-acetylesterase [Chitinophaga sp. CF118]
MRKILFLTGILFPALLLQSAAQVRLPRLVRDSMVLQRNVPVNLWGWASPGEAISIRFCGKRFKATTANDGRWFVKMPPLQAGGPYTMSIDGSNHIQLNDILVGDVWVCSGQSNMVHQMQLHRERYADDIANAQYPEIRQFRVSTMTDLKTAHDDLPTGFWKAATTQDVSDFSAVAYFFARNIFRQYHVPIGLINASVGGTPIEAWTSEDGLQEFPSITATIRKNKDYFRPAVVNKDTVTRDAGLINRPEWYNPDYIPMHWRQINIPGYWEDQGANELNGTVWYRREIDVPVSMTGIPSKLSLGRIVDADVVYINGQQVGNTTYQYPQRRYQLPAGTLKAGKNLIVVRVTNYGGKGGFVPDKPYYLSAGKDTLDLKGTWFYKVGEVSTTTANNGIQAQESPTALYNAMLAPLTSYPIKGILWYQGESNAGDPAAYAQLLPALIRDWRNKWREGNIPFLYVQLPNFMDVQYLPSESNWAATREAQRKALALPNTGMAVTIDLGEWNDIHPDRKKEVGDRLALLAKKMAYNEQQLVATGPLYENAKSDGNKVIISFSSTGSGLITNDGEAPAQFAVAGADKKFVWANARIEGNTVIVWSNSIPSPRYVRYAWADNPDNPNLSNREGLLASPFEINIPN